MNRRLGTLAVLLVALAPALAAANDAPHDQSFSDGDCSHCHQMYSVSPGGKPNYNHGCIACHGNVPNSRRGFPWFEADQAIPGQVGDQHNWSGFAANAKLGVRAPTATDIAQRLVDGKLQCAVCHDPHSANAANTPNSLHVSVPVGEPIDSPAAGSSYLTVVSPGTAVKSYRVQVSTASAVGGTFILSHDYGLATPTWFNWNGGAWVAGTIDGAGKPYANDAAVELDEPGVTVQIAAGAAVGNYWDFSVSYPMVRSGNVDDGFCKMCHAERFMSAAKVRGDDSFYRPNGVRKFSHPVLEALNSNGKNYDRAPGDVLDANGVAQGIGDGNATNDLRISDGVVRCSSCHAVHNADSNSLTP